MTTYNVTAFGAIADGQTLNTRAIQAAIDAAAQAGGGVVSVPPGRYLTGSVFVKSNVTLDLGAGATLLGSPHRQDYPVIAYDAQWDNEHAHLIVIKDAMNAGVCGQGTIDGQGHAFWQPQPDPETWIKPQAWRPGAMLAVVNSQDVRLDGVLLTQPPGWASDIFGSDRVSVRGLRIVNDHRTPNNDGIDISGSHDVIISDTYIDTGDDGIVINTRPRDVRRVSITNCIIRSECAALKIGWEWTLHDIRQISISNCVIFGSNRGVAFYTCNGAVLEDITISNIVFESNVAVIVPRPIHMDLRKGRDTGTFGAIRDVSISNMVARTQGRILLTAEAGGQLENITLRDVHLIYPYIEDPCYYGKVCPSNQFSNHNPQARQACAAIVAENITGLVVENLRVTWPDGSVPDDWRLPAKRENGGYTVHHPEYSTPRPVEFSLLWGRGLHSGYVNAPLARPATARAVKYDLQDSTIHCT